VSTGEIVRSAPWAAVLLAEKLGGWSSCARLDGRVARHHTLHFSGPLKIASNFSVLASVQVEGKVRRSRLAIGSIISSTKRSPTGCPNVVPQLVDLPEFTSVHGVSGISTESNLAAGEHATANFTDPDFPIDIAINVAANIPVRFYAACRNVDEYDESIGQTAGSYGGSNSGTGLVDDQQH
jgi:hypothetical protein